MRQNLQCIYLYVACTRQHLTGMERPSEVKLIIYKPARSSETSSIRLMSLGKTLLTKIEGWNKISCLGNLHIQTAAEFYEFHPNSPFLLDGTAVLREQDTWQIKVDIRQMLRYGTFPRIKLGSGGPWYERVRIKHFMRTSSGGKEGKHPFWDVIGSLYIIHVLVPTTEAKIEVVMTSFPWRNLHV